MKTQTKVTIPLLDTKGSIKEDMGKALIGDKEVKAETIVFKMLL